MAQLRKVAYGVESITMGFINIVTYTGCGSVTNNMTRVRIGYWIYSLR
jgi:hypothetical protein